MKNLFLVFMLSINSAFGQFLPNSVGVTYLTEETEDSYRLTVVVPKQTLENQYSLGRDFQFRHVLDSITLSQNLVFFDSIGALHQGTYETVMEIKFWCENDGGTQYRPTFTLTIPKSEFKRKLQANEELQNIACFIIFNVKSNRSLATTIDSKLNTVLTGDFNNDSIPDCYIYTFLDEAENCDGQPRNNLVINLAFGNQYFPLRCCGP